MDDLPISLATGWERVPVCRAGPLCQDAWECQGNPGRNDGLASDDWLGLQVVGRSVGWLVGCIPTVTIRYLYSILVIVGG